MHKKLSLGIAILLCMQGAVAQEEKTWTGEGEFGVNQTTGNTEYQNIIGKLAFTYTPTETWKHGLKLEALRTEDEERVTGESYELNLRSDYNLLEKGFLFGAFRYEDDKFSGYDYQSKLSFGYGQKFIDTKPRFLEVRAGGGVKQSQLENSDESELEAILDLGLTFRQKVSSNSEFTQEFSVEIGDENIHSESNTGFLVNIGESNMALKLSLDIKNNTEVPPDTEKTDTVTAVTLMYSF